MIGQRTAVMRNALIAAAIIVVGAGAWGTFVTARHAAASASEKTVTSATMVIPVQGMTCAVCAASVKKTLQSMEGVESAEIDLEKRQVRVRYSEGKVSPDKLVAAINQLGYKAGAPVHEPPQ